MDDHDIEALERATLAALPPQQLMEVEGWLVGLDEGTVGRAHSAVPLRHRSITPDSVHRAREAFAAAGRAPVYRLPQLAAFDTVRAMLAADGFDASTPTLTQAGPLQGITDLQPSVPVRLLAEPDEAWSRVFLGEGFDPVDGASRMAILRRGRHSVFAAALVDGEVAAVGLACNAHGWCGIHGMRTLPAFRGRGLATAILGALARDAAAKGVRRAFLQVEQANAAAQQVYRRAGLETVWCYEYWSRGT
jgi:ribosomal protein S18 acetylase RimI-like enzyme